MGLEWFTITNQRIWPRTRYHHSRSNGFFESMASGGPVDGACEFRQRMLELNNEQEHMVQRPIVANICWCRSVDDIYRIRLFWIVLRSQQIIWIHLLLLRISRNIEVLSADRLWLHAHRRWRFGLLRAAVCSACYPLGWCHRALEKSLQGILESDWCSHKIAKRRSIWELNYIGSDTFSLASQFGVLRHFIFKGNQWMLSASKPLNEWGLLGRPSLPDHATTHSLGEV